MFDKGYRKRLLDEVAELKGEIRLLRSEKQGAEEALGLVDEVADLKRKVADLKVEESQLKERHEREKRDIEHMVGLERKRQEFEVEQAKRETMVEVKQANLAADRERFEEQMKFMQDRLTQEVTYLKDDILKVVLDRLPTVTVDRSIEERRSTKAS